MMKQTTNERQKEVEEDRVNGASESIDRNKRTNADAGQEAAV